MTWAVVGGSLAVVLTIVAVSCLVIRNAQPESVAPANLPAWAVTTNLPAGTGPSAAPVVAAVPAAASTVGTPVAGREPNRWQSGACELGPNLVVNADFGALAGGLPAGWESLGSNSLSFALFATNSPFRSFFGDNGRVARFCLQNAGAAGTSAFRLRLGSRIHNDAGTVERVLFAWDVQAAAGTDAWIIEDRAGGKSQAFSVQVGRENFMLNRSEYALARFTPGAWYHIELYVNYDDPVVCVEGLLYDAAGKVVRTWRKVAPVSVADRKEAAVGCEELVVRAMGGDGGRLVLIDNLYIGLVHQRR
jgi:hypothetical protein